MNLWLAAGDLDSSTRLYHFCYQCKDTTDTGCDLRAGLKIMLKRSSVLKGMNCGAKKKKRQKKLLNS